MKWGVWALPLVLGMLCGCSSRHVPLEVTSCSVAVDPDYELWVFVDARGLDYRSASACMKSLVRRHREDLEGDVGHAWFLLRGNLSDQKVWRYGGHSGETGSSMPTYVQGVVELLESGDAEPNPVKYLWATMNDGFFEEGDGGHIPTMVAKVSLSAEEFALAWTYTDPRYYDYQTYSLTEHQCCTLVEEVAAIAGVVLDSRVTLPIEKTVRWSGRKVVLWEDPTYAWITLPTPDKLQESLRRAVKAGKMEGYTLPSS